MSGVHQDNPARAGPVDVDGGLDDWLRTVDEERFRHYLPYEAEIINRSYIDELVYGVKRGRTNASRLFALMLLKPSLASE